MKLHSQDSGPGPEKTIVFLHGFPFNQHMWDEQAALAKNLGLRVVTFDLRGHGQSETGTGQYGFEMFVDDLLELLDTQKITKAILCGLSMGGYIALRFTERAPERVSGLILCDTRSEADSNEGKIKRSETAKTIQNKGPKVFCESFLKAVLTPETMASQPAIVERVRQMILANSATGMIGSAIAMGGRTDTTESLSRIQVPTLLLVGEKDQITPPSAAEAMHKKIPHSKLIIIPHAAHLSNLENPAAFNSAFHNFLSTLSA